MADIEKELNDIKNAVYGREVRGAIHDGIKKINEEVENTTDRQDSVEAQFQSVLDETTGKDVISAPEITAARVGADDTNYPNLKERLDTEYQKLSSRLDTEYQKLSSRLDTEYQKLSSQLAQTEHKINRVKFSELQEPIFIAHRGGLNIFPENTLEAYEGCLSMGINVIELDVQQLADGALAVMHSTSMGSVTNRSGNVRDYSTAGFKRAKVTILPGWDNVHPALFEEVLSRFGNNAIYVIESKDKKSAKKIADTLKRYRLEEYACIQSSELKDLQEVANEGIPLMILSSSANPEPDPQQAKSNNIDYIGVPTSASESYIRSCISAGLKVVVWAVNRRYERDYFLNLGVSGFFTDDPLYVQGKSPVLSRDPFREQVFTHGMITIPRDEESQTGGNRGEFVASNKFGWAKPDPDSYYKDFCLQGWAGVLPTSFNLTAKMTLNASTDPNHWGSIAFC